MRIQSFALLSTLVLAACMGDDGVHHLPDAPSPGDARIDSALDAPDAPTEHSLGIAFGGTGSGRVTSSPAGIACASSCSSSFPAGTRVTLTAEPDASSRFAGWTGACSGDVPVCELTIEQASSVTARFALETYSVTVAKAGPGTGHVAGHGLACGSTCTITVDHGTMISLAATPTALSHFVGWGDACTGSGACVLTITADTTISAVFALDDLSLVVTRGGNGDGTIASTPAGIACGIDCSEVYTANQMVALSATPAASSTFAGWSGACSGTGACVVTMDAAKTVTGTFALRRHALTVQKTGSGTGVVTSTPAGIACGTDCAEDFDHGTAVSLTATASPNHLFTGWSGACSGTGPCVVAMDAAKTVTATFAIATFDLTVATVGTGTGTVTAPQIACPGDCSGTFPFGTMVTLVPTAGTGSTFAGWGGACSGTGACIVTIDAAKTVTATFALSSYDLTVATVGTGTVTAPQIACPGDCTGTFAHGTQVTLVQAAGTGYTFTGWSGACSGTGACVVTMDAAKSVTATFELDLHDLTVATAGPGTGTVTAPQIACPGDCAGTYGYGTQVTLVQAAGIGSTFTGWSGACSGTGACVVTMDAAKTVTATFALDNHDLTVAVIGSGTVTAPQIACPGDCTGTYAHGTFVTLTQAAGLGYTFTGWGGPCTGTGGCIVAMDAAKTVTATFTIKSYDLTVATVGTGTVTATQIACPGDCTGTYTHGTQVTLSQAAGTGYAFTGWSGACSGAGACVVTMDAAKSVTATFTIKSYDLTVATVGAGTVTAPQINCPGDCTGTYPHGTQVTLAPAAATGYAFTGWSGACSGAGSCVVTMDAAKSVIATFTLNSYDLAVTVTGMGTVMEAQIACPGDCTGTYPHGTTVTLAQAAATGYTFTGWSGACSGTGACVVTMDAAKAVSATFTIESYDLTVGVTGSGSVTALPQIACPGDCVGTFSHGTQVTLAASADTGNMFVGWGGACSGTGPCVVTLDAAKSVTATFSIASYPLSVSVVGNGSVTSSPAGITACTPSSGTCSASFVYPAMVTLAASQTGAGSTASVFKGWSGACAGYGTSPTCVVTMTAAASARATFAIAPNIIFTSSTTYISSLGGMSGAYNKCLVLARNAGLVGTGPNQNQRFIAVLSTSQLSFAAVIASISPAVRGWARRDGLPVFNTIDDVANNVVFNPPYLDENGSPVASPRVWTGTSPSGQASGVCSGAVSGGGAREWDGDPTGNGTSGVTNVTDSRIFAAGPLYCGNFAHLLCLGVDRFSLVGP